MPGGGTTLCLLGFFFFIPPSPRIIGGEKVWKEPRTMSPALPRLQGSSLVEPQTARPPLAHYRTAAHISFGNARRFLFTPSTGERTLAARAVDFPSWRCSALSRSRVLRVRRRLSACFGLAKQRVAFCGRPPFSYPAERSARCWPTPLLWRSSETAHWTSLWHFFLKI